MQAVITRACSHYQQPIGDERDVDKSDKLMSRFSNREKMQRKPLSLRNSRSISLRRLYMARLYSHGVTRFCLGVTTGIQPRLSASCRVHRLRTPSPSTSATATRFTQPAQGRRLWTSDSCGCRSCASCRSVWAGRAMCSSARSRTRSRSTLADWTGSRCHAGLADNARSAGTARR